MPDMDYVQGYASDDVADQDILDGGWSANERLRDENGAANDRRLKVAALCDSDAALSISADHFALVVKALNLPKGSEIWQVLHAIDGMRHAHFTGVTVAVVALVIAETNSRRHCDYSSCVKDIIDTADRLRLQPNAGVKPGRYVE